MNEKPGLEPGFFFARRVAGGLTGYVFGNGRGRTMPKSQTNCELRQTGHDEQNQCASTLSYPARSGCHDFSSGRAGDAA